MKAKLQNFLELPLTPSSVPSHPFLWSPHQAAFEMPPVPGCLKGPP